MRAALIAIQNGHDYDEAYRRYTEAEKNNKVLLPQGLKGESMADLLKKLKASTDPEMRKLAQALAKQFPPKEDEEAAPKKKDEAPEGTPEEEGSETSQEEQDENPDSENEEEFDGNEELDETEGDGQENPVRNEVIKVLEELGLIAPADQMSMAARITDLTKRVAPLQKLSAEHQALKKQYADLSQAHSILATRSEEITKDLAVISTNLESMTKGLPSPVLREIQGSAMLQGVQITEYLRKMADENQNPLIRQALLFEIQQIEIKSVQKGN